VSHHALSESQFGYHVAPKAYRSSIERRGLDPRKSETGGKEVWLFTDPGRTEGGPHMDVWRANLTGMHVSHGSTASAEWNEGDPIVVVGKRVKPSRLRRENED
jgi:hypothetical protein